MGKGNRNRLDRMDAVKESPKAAPKAKKPRKPLAKGVKIAIAGFLAFLIVAGIVVGALSSNGVFRNKVTIVSADGSDIKMSEGVATALLWINGFKHGTTQEYGAATMLTYLSYFGSSSSSSTSSYLLSMIQSFLSGSRTYLRNYPGNAFSNEDNQKLLRNYAGLNAIAGNSDIGISLSDEERKTAKQNADTYISVWMEYANSLASSNLLGTTGYSQKDYRADSCSSQNEFLTKYVGKNVAKADVEEAMRISMLYEKVYADKFDKIESSFIKDGVMDEAALVEYLAGHMEDFYNSYFISYDVTEKTELAEALKSAASLKEFKRLVATDVMEGVYAELFNKYYAENGKQAEDIQNLLKGTFNKNMDRILGMAYHSAELADEITDNVIKTWVTDKNRKVDDTEAVKLDDGSYYTIVYIASGTREVGEGDNKEKKTTYTYAVKKDTKENADELVKVITAFADQNYKDDDANKATTEKIFSLLGLTKKADKAADLPDTVKTWVTDSSRKVGDTNLTVIKDDGIYVTLILAEKSNDTYTYASRKFDLVAAEAGVDGDSNFKTNLINSVLINLEIIDETDDIKEVYNTDSKAENDEDEARITAAVSILKDMKSQVNTALTAESKSYIAPKDENDDREDLIKWLFTKKTADECKTDRPEGTATVIEATTGEGDSKKTTKTAYVITEPMKLDDEDAVWGGYVKFTGDDRTTKAAEAQKKLEGKTGAELWQALQELGATTKYGFESGDFSTTTELSKWLMDKDRKNGEISKDLTGKEKQSSSSSSSSTTSTEVDVSYVAAVLERTVCWKATAFSAMINDQLSDWIDEQGKIFNVSASGYATTEETTAADK